MSANSKIEWTGATWTPIRARRKDTGKVGVHCERVSAGCKNCYSATFNKRNLPVHGTGLDFTIPNRDLVEIFLDEEMLIRPLRWRKPKKIFVYSQTDLFADFVPYEMIDRVFGMMAMCPQHTFQVLTKRPERMRDVIGSSAHSSRMVEVLNIGTGNVMSASWITPLDNVWLGVSVEYEPTADERTEWLRRTPAAKRFISYEPALGPVQFDLTGIDWLIAGGESGRHARPAHPDWFRSVRDQCIEAGVAYFHKQNGEWMTGEHVDDEKRYATQIYFDGRWRPCSDDWATEQDNGPIFYRVGKKRAGRLLDGREWSQFPEVRS